MSKRNYSKMSTEAMSDGAVDILVTAVDEAVKAEPAEVEIPATMSGRVINCGKLNIRKRPTVKSAVVSTVVVGSKVTVDSKTLTDEWLGVVTESGVEGFCMSKYVTIEQ